MDVDRVWIYYISFNLYNFSTGLVGIFLNLFVLATSSLLGVIYFNIFYYGSLELSYFATIYALDYFSPKDLYVAGSVIRAFTLLFILFAALFVSNILAFGFLYGVSIGTFWLGNNIIMSDISKGVDRNEFSLRVNAIGNAVNLVAPTAAGIIIEYSQFTGPLRFGYDFIAAAIILLAAAYLLHQVKFPKEEKVIKFRPHKSIISHSNYRYFKLYYMFWCMFSIPFSIILPIYVFFITKSYVITGIYGSVTLLIALFSTYLIKMGSKYWKLFLNIAIASSIIISILLFIPSSRYSLSIIFIYTIIYTIFSTPLQVQATANFLDMIDRSKIDRIHFWINREYYITAGRTVAFAAIALTLIYFKSDIVYSIYLIPPMSLYLLTCAKTSEEIKHVERPHIYKSSVKLQ